MQCGIQWQPGTEPKAGLIPLPGPQPSLPEDAAILGIQFHQERDQFIVTIASETFDVVPEDQWPPFLNPMPQWLPCKALRVELVNLPPELPGAPAVEVKLPATAPATPESAPAAEAPAQ